MQTGRTGVVRCDLVVRGSDVAPPGPFANPGERRGWRPSGLRPCEYVALKVGRLDLLRGTVRVAEAAPEVAGRLEWGGVKTHEARTVRLPRSVAEELGAYLTCQLRLRLHDITGPQPPLDGKELERFSHLLA